MLCRGTPMLIVNPSLPAKTVQELVAYAKANPGKLSYGLVRHRHLCAPQHGRSSSSAPGIDMQHVPYQGRCACARTVCSATRCRCCCSTSSSVEEHAKAGKVRCSRRPPTSAFRRCRTCRRSAKPCRASPPRCGSALWGPAKHAARASRKISADVSKALDHAETQGILQDQQL